MQDGYENSLQSTTLLQVTALSEDGDEKGTLCVQSNQKFRHRDARRQLDKYHLRDVQCRVLLVANPLYDRGCCNKVSMKKEREIWEGERGLNTQTFGCSCASLSRLSSSTPSGAAVRRSPRLSDLNSKVP